MEDFVTFKIAKKLKENGFDLPILEVYGKFDIYGIFHSQLYFNYTGTWGKEEFIAPTIEQAFKWLRNNKKTMISILPVAFNEKENKFNKYYCTIYYATKEFVFESHERPDTFETYEECALEAIEYVLDNLI